jgi:hypothetical protein
MVAAPGRSTWPLAVGTAGVALAFLLPNHSPPWMFCLQEAMAAVAMMVLCAPVLMRAGAATPWRAPEALALGLLVVVALQAGSGRIPFVQIAWMHGLYLLGFVLAILAGGTWERREPGVVLRALMTAAMSAALPSVALQIYQWLALAPAEGSAWVYRALSRPAANLGQPNLLATVMVLALLATYGLWRRRSIGTSAALAVAACLLTGLGMTQSRTGLLNVLIVAGAIMLWRRRQRESMLAVSIFALLAWLCLAFVGSAVLGPGAAGGGSTLLASRFVGGSRVGALRLAVEAILAEPFTGYGWGQSFLAQWTQALNGAPVYAVMLSAHNIVLDLALWAGLPIALSVLVGALMWFRFCLRRVTDEGVLLLLLVVAVLFVHALFEYPLAYTFFLLPLGLAVGALGERAGLRTLFRTPPGVAAALLVAAGVGLALTARDYLKVEESYRNLLYEKAGLIGSYDRAPPEVLVLTSLRDLIVFSRLEPSAGLSQSELHWMANVVLVHPGAHGMAKVAAALALNGRAGDAQQWVDRLCRIYLPVQCQAQARDWAERAEQAPELLAIRWPSLSQTDAPR